jgi:NADPH:quinone reductase-like Zn-dependent oxidoreductase
VKAVVYSEYGGPKVLRLVDVEKPVPGPDEVLVKVRAAALNPVDWHFVRGTPFPLRMAAGGLRRPRRHRRVGSDYAGTVEAIGSAVNGITLGQPVFGMGEGSLAEYLAAPADRLGGYPDGSRTIALLRRRTQHHVRDELRNWWLTAA